MSKVVLSIEDVSKQYRLGTIGTGTISHDLNRWWHVVRGKEDPYAKIGTVNNRALNDGNEYVWALKDINLQIHDGDVVGIIGKNGAGKSTLLKLLSQVTNPTTGKIKVKGRIASLLEVGTGFHPELTGKENIYLNGAILGMSKSEVTRKLDEIVDFAGVARYLDTPVKRYSSGMKVRLGFAVAAHLEPEILVVDEVLAVGDAEFQKKCIGKMKAVSEQGRTVLFVSHNMTSIRNLCSRGVLIDDGMITYDGEIEECVSNYLEINREDIPNIATYTDLTNKIGVASIQSTLPTFEFMSDRVEFQAKLKIGIDMPDLYLGVIVEDTKSNVILVSSSDELEENVLRNIKTGEYVLHFGFSGQILKPGRYYLTFSLRSTGDQIFHKESRAISFKIEDTKTFRGVKGRYRSKAIIAPTVDFALA
ncbi:MAG: ABC transporter ATP-binding protein [Salibacteraceae bacterium]